MAWRHRSLAAFGAVLMLAALPAVPVSADELYDAVRTGNVSRALTLLESGADPNIRSPYDGPLHVAARLGQSELVIALLKAGSDIELSGYGGAHPLHAAALAGQKEIVSILLERGAQVDALDNVGRTALMTFVSGEAVDTGTLRILLTAGADPNRADAGSHLYALDYAVIQGRADESAILVAAGADVNSKDSLFGKSPLHYATGYDAVHGTQEVVQFLIEHGADVNARDFAGITPLDYAKIYSPNNGLLHQILKAAGAQ
ncbi:MAG: ankyrin repeat domain-containing protein [Hyphomicrobiales bacterium]